MARKIAGRVISHSLSPAKRYVDAAMFKNWDSTADRSAAHSRYLPLHWNNTDNDTVEPLTTAPLMSYTVGLGLLRRMKSDWAG